MKKIVEWIMLSNRWKHLVGGFAIGVSVDDWFAAIYAGVLTAGALEYKDKAYGGNWDWIDLGLTVAGTCVEQLVRTIV